MLYHSEPITRTVTLWAVKKLYPKDYALWKEVEKGALTSASNKERKEYFRYACATLAFFIIPLILFSLLSMFLLMLITHSMNLWVGFAFILIFIANAISGSFSKKIKQCDTNVQPVAFTTNDLVITVLKVAFWCFLLAGVLTWAMN